MTLLYFLALPIPFPKNEIKYSNIAALVIFSDNSNYLYPNLAWGPSPDGAQSDNWGNIEEQGHEFWVSEPDA